MCLYAGLARCSYTVSYCFPYTSSLLYTKTIVHIPILFVCGLISERWCLVPMVDKACDSCLHGNGAWCHRHDNWACTCSQAELYVCGRWTQRQTEWSTGRRPSITEHIYYMYDKWIQNRIALCFLVCMQQNIQRTLFYFAKCRFFLFLGLLKPTLLLYKAPFLL